MFILFAALAVTTALAEPPAARGRATIPPERIDAMLESPDRHVRAMDRDAAALLAGGARRSWTFAQLLDAIERSDVIVMVQVVEDMPLSVAGRLTLLVSAHGHRYLRVQLAAHAPEADMIATLGHELQHAVEVADAPDVHNEPALIALYKRIGHRSAGSQHFDTLAARETGKTVRGELG